MSDVTPVVPTAGQSSPPLADTVNGSLRVITPGEPKGHADDTD